jgi:hypothetical protein
MTGACLNAPKPPPVLVPIRAEGEAAVFAIRQTTPPEMINVAICNARLLASFWRPWRWPRWSFFCCTSYSDRRPRAAITFGKRATAPIPSRKITNRIEAASMTLPRVRDRIPAFCFGAVSLAQENGFVDGAVPMFAGSHGRPFVNRGSVSSRQSRKPQGPARVTA